MVSSRASDAFLDFVCGQDLLFTCSDIRQSSLVEFTPFVHLLVDFNAWTEPETAAVESYQISESRKHIATAGDSGYSI